MQSYSYSGGKLLILALLSLNVFIFAIYDTLISAIDALSWVILLLMYELEAIPGLKHRLTENQQRTIRNGLIVVILAVFFSYLGGSEWLDVINALLWFALIAFLELEIRYPEQVKQYEKLFWLSTVVIFFALVAMVVAWLWQSAWLNAYDAALWIAAFAIIEVDLFKFLQPKKV